MILIPYWVNFYIVTKIKQPPLKIPHSNSKIPYPQQ